MIKRSGLPRSGKDGKLLFVRRCAITYFHKRAPPEGTIAAHRADFERSGKVWIAKFGALIGT